jgi:hypothetical protein
MSTKKNGIRYRITVDRDALVIEPVCGPKGDDSGQFPEAVVEELEGQQGLLHAIVSWFRPQRLYTDNSMPNTARLTRACERLGVTVIHPRLGMPQAKGRVERMRGMRRQVSR